MFEMSVTALEGPRAFHKRAIEMPELGPEDVWVEVHAVGCNYADMLMTWGKYQRRLEPPFVPGFEAAGVVLRVGAAVKGVAPGDRVLSLTDWGAYATHVRAHQNHVFKIPTSLAFEQAVALGVTYQTAWVALVDRVALKKTKPYW